MSDHALLSPSKAPRWIPCPGSIALCADIPNTTSAYADEGTAAHENAAIRLSRDPRMFCIDGEPFPVGAKDQETQDYINVYVNAVRNAAEGKILLVEQHLSIERWTSEKGGKGTADAVIIDLENAAIEVWDLKFGRGHVVFAENNEQLMLYALGALDMVELIYGPVKTIKLVICQPRRDHISQQTIPREELLRFGKAAREAGEIAIDLLDPIMEDEIKNFLNPSETACLFCPAKATCPALMQLVTDTVFEEFSVQDNGDMKAELRKVGTGSVPSEGMLNMVSDWVKAELDWIDAGLRAGEDRPGWKLVLGKKGNRKFNDLKEVEKLLKSLKFKKDQIYETSLIPITKIEKLVPKPKWPVFEKLIVQSEAQPIAVSSSDKRPAYTSKLTVENFEEVTFDAFK